MTRVRTKQSVGVVGIGRKSRMRRHVCKLRGFYAQELLCKCQRIRGDIWIVWKFDARQKDFSPYDILEYKKYGLSLTISDG